MTGRVLSSSNYALQLYERRTATYLKLAAVSLFGAGVSLAMWVALA